MFMEYTSSRLSHRRKVGRCVQTVYNVRGSDLFIARDSAYTVGDIRVVFVKWVFDRTTDPRTVLG